MDSLGKGEELTDTDLNTFVKNIYGKEDVCSKKYLISTWNASDDVK